MNFKHALTCATAALVLVAAAGCSPGAEAPSDASAPTSVVHAPDAPPATAAAPPSPTDGQSEEIASAREWEAKWLKDFPEAAKREGGVLTLFTGGTPVASFNDASSPWAFTGALKTPGPNGERLFFRVTNVYSDEEGRTEWIDHWFDPSGQFIPSHDVLDQNPGHQFIPSNSAFGQNPGRTMIAAGDYVYADVGVDPHLSLMDWSGEPKLVYEFKSGCYPVKWISDDELEAACPYAYTGLTTGDDEIIPARVVRAGPREWRLQQDGLPTRNMPNPPQTAPFDETVTAAEIAPDPGFEAALSEAGYQRLDR
ncbi:hypothetical protein [Hyphomonas sp.]|uniref:hypothetical protein n=1 Tax=Hyphomonas sp. TaxID=87 RepID=UPI0025BB1997|nr:hypothetical protein [Hyphomonas sp.]